MNARGQQGNPTQNQQLVPFGVFELDLEAVQLIPVRSSLSRIRPGKRVPRNRETPL
jgi:hypothetical protein